jgi:hypothetical protein
MNDNLPEINFKEKKEKKKGVIGWLRGRLGMGSRGAMGEAGISPSAMNVGRAMGAGKFGASSGIAGLLAGKAGMLATVAAVAVASGVYLANQAPAPSSNGAFNSGGAKVQDNYVPAILRSQAANQGSSLDMFKDTNKGAGLAMEEDPSKKAAKPADGAPVSAGEEAAQEQPATEQGNMAQEMMGKLQGGNIGELSSSMGGGSNKFSSMGGFGNKFNQGQMGAKTGFTSGIGSGFQGMPKFDSRKAKMTAMKPSAKPVFSKAGAGKKGKFGTGAFGQAKGMRATQKSYSGNQADQMAHTQTAAWTGATPEGSVDGGAGLGDGGAGIMSSPSLDTAGSGGGGGGAGNPDDVATPETPSPEDVSPWKNLLANIMMLVIISCLLSYIAANIQLWWVRWIVAAIALILALAAIAMAAKIMGEYGQKMMGALYIIGGMMAAYSAIMAFGGSSDKAPGTEKIMWALLGAGVISLVGSMLGGK